MGHQKDINIIDYAIFLNIKINNLYDEQNYENCF